MSSLQGCWDWYRSRYLSEVSTNSGDTFKFTDDSVRFIYHLPNKDGDSTLGCLEYEFESRRMTAEAVDLSYHPRSD